MFVVAVIGALHSLSHESKWFFVNSSSSHGQPSSHIFFPPRRKLMRIERNRMVIKNAKKKYFFGVFLSLFGQFFAIKLDFSLARWSHDDDFLFFSTRWKLWLWSESSESLCAWQIRWQLCWTSETSRESSYFWFFRKNSIFQVVTVTHIVIYIFQEMLKKCYYSCLSPSSTFFFDRFFSSLHPPSSTFRRLCPKSSLEFHANCKYRPRKQHSLQTILMRS